MFQKKTERRWEVAPPTNDDVMNLLANDGLLLSGGSADPPNNNKPSLAKRFMTASLVGRAASHLKYKYSIRLET